MRARSVIAIILSLVFIVSVSAFQPQQTLEERVSRLEQLVENLSARVSELEEQLQVGNRQVPASRQAWRQLEPGMTKEDVRQLLGEPAEIFRLPTIESWYYGDHPDRGKVDFDSRGNVTGWSEP